MDITKLLIFTVVSSLEYIAMLVLIFTIFRIQFRYFKFHMLFVCVSLSYVSYTMRVDGLADITPIVQLGILFILMWLLFQFHIFYAAIISVTGYFLYILIQLLIVYPAHLLNLIDMNNVELASITANLFAILSSGVVILISLFIKRKNWGFAYVPHSDSIKVNYRKSENITLLIVMIFSIIGFGIVYYFSLIEFDPILVFCLIFLSICITGLLLYFSVRKERYEYSD